MPRAFVKQPDGRLAIWSSVVDQFVTVNCTADEAIAEALADDAKRGPYPGNIREDLCRELENISNTGRAWEWAPTWDEAIVTILELHGAEEVTKLTQLMMNPA